MPLTGLLYWLTVFFTRCGHCKRMTPEYKALGDAVEKDPKLKARVVVAKVSMRGHQQAARFIK